MFRSTLQAMAPRRKRLFLVLLGLSLASGAAAAPLFAILNADKEAAPQNWAANTGSWLLFVAALLLYGAAWVVWEQSSRGAPEEGTHPDLPVERLHPPVERVLLAGLFLFALAIRLYNLDTIPPGLWFDEAQNGIVAQRLLAPGAAHVVYIGDRYTQSGMLDLYFTGQLIGMFGNLVWPLRVLPALSGAICVPFLYLLASRLYGWRVGLAAAAIVSVSAWHITFSRFLSPLMWTVAIDVIGYFFIAQALRTGRLGWYAGAGVILGLGLHSYYPAKFAFVVLFAVLLHRLITERVRVVKAMRAGVVVFAVGVLLAFMPLGLFAAQNWNEYMARVNTVSIFNPTGTEGRQDALNLRVQKHALMFNWQGDRNGRHNLPGAPMLDWVTASLFLAGLASCVVRVWRWQYFFPIVWFITSITGGVLALVFEAPQAGRTVENSVVTALVAGIFLGEVWKALARADVLGWVARQIDLRKQKSARQHVGLQISPRPYKRSLANRLAWALSTAGVLLILWWVAGTNLERYFVAQANDLGVWKDMNSRQMHAGVVMNRYGADHDIWLAPVIKGLPPSEYLAPDVEVSDWPGMQALPLASGKSGGAVIGLDLSSAGDVAWIADMYPNARFEILTAPSNPEPLMYTIVIPASDITALRGVYATIDPSSGSTTDRTLAEFSYDPASEEVTTGTLRLAATLRVDLFGAYKFAWQDADGEPSPGEVIVDGNALPAGEPITLAVGLHTLEVVAATGGGEGVSSLMWTLPDGTEETVPAANLFDPRKIGPRGLTALLREGTGFDGEVKLSRVDPFISFYIHKLWMPKRPYTVEWLGRIFIPADGTYTFGTEQISSSVLYIDGKALIKNERHNSYVEGRSMLTKGWHDIRLLFVDQTNSSHMYLYWKPPDRPRSIIPSAFLRPDLGDNPLEVAREDLPGLDDWDGSKLPPGRAVYVNQTSSGVKVEPRNEPSAHEAPRATVQSAESTVEARPTVKPTVKATVEARPTSAPGNSPTQFEGRALNPIFVVGDGERKLDKPKAVAGDREGNIYIFTEGDSKVHKLDPTGKEVKTWDVKNKEGQLLTEGSAIVVLGEQVLVLDAATSTAIEFTRDGERQGEVVLCKCYFPRAMAVSRDGNLWVANTGLAQVLKVSPEGKMLQKLGTKGTEPGQVLEPAGVWEAEDGTLFVADAANRRVQSFAPNGLPLKEWSMGQSSARDGNRLAGDEEGNVLVTQFESRAIVKYDSKGKELVRWVYRVGEQVPIPSGIAAVGGGKFVILFTRAGRAIVFRAEE